MKSMVSGLEDRLLEGLPSGEKRGLLKEVGLRGPLGEKVEQHRRAEAETGESELA